MTSPSSPGALTNGKVGSPVITMGDRASSASEGRTALSVATEGSSAAAVAKVIVSAATSAWARSDPSAGSVLMELVELPSSLEVSSLSLGAMRAA